MKRIKSFNEVGQGWRKVPEDKVSTIGRGERADEFTPGEVQRVIDAIGRTGVSGSLHECAHEDSSDLGRMLDNVPNLTELRKSKLPGKTAEMDTGSDKPVDNLFFYIREYTPRRIHGIDMFKTTDEYFYARIVYDISNAFDRVYYVCDQLAGLISLLGHLLSPAVPDDNIDESRSVKSYGAFTESVADESRGIGRSVDLSAAGLGIVLVDHMPDELINIHDTAVNYWEETRDLFGYEKERVPRETQVRTTQRHVSSTYLDRLAEDPAEYGASDIVMAEGPDGGLWVMDGHHRLAHDRRMGRDSMAYVIPFSDVDEIDYTFYGGGDEGDE